MINTALPTGAAAIVNPPEVMNDTSPNDPNLLPKAPVERSRSVTPTHAQPTPTLTAPEDPPKESTPLGHCFQPEYFAAKAHPWHSGDRNKDPSNTFLCNLLAHIELDFNCIMQYLNNRFYKDQLVSEPSDTLGFIKAFQDFFDNGLDELHKLHHESVAYMDENHNHMTMTNQDPNV
ncbi:hypothetical protein OPQ81_008450 [Rhizoctonia solani]|nr:hypothetical protein OPQ81_008450 [Rhizoctonia solani]